MIGFIVLGKWQQEPSKDSPGSQSASLCDGEVAGESAGGEGVSTVSWGCTSGCDSLGSLN